MDKSELLVGIICATIAFILFVAGVITAFFIAHKRRLQQEIRITLIELKYERELRQVENEVGEQMMEQFAQELHDNIGHILTTMRLQIENRKLDEPNLVQIFTPLESSLDDASKQLQLLSRSLNSDYISNIGLSCAIELEVEKLQQFKRFDVSLEVKPLTLALDKNQELMTFRIFQEILNNIIKHSKAKHISISLYPSRQVYLQISDDGKGFSYEQTVRSTKASGIRNIIKRASMAGIECVIESAPGAGCTYQLRHIGENTN